MYEKDELIIDPEYQRLFRWSEGTQSRFIESLLLELPIPPLFVIERSEGIYELIDGLQRISTYMHFRGRHPERKNEDDSFHELVLSDCDIVHQLNGLTFDNLPKALQIKLRRNFTRVEVIRKESDPRLRYYMFKRLNTGGEELSQQEIRNCIIRILDSAFVNFLIDLSRNGDFGNCINISEGKYMQRYDEGLVLRFFAFKNYRNKYVHDVEDFMTKYAECVASKRLDFNYDNERNLFERTFKILNNTLNINSFSAMNDTGRFVYRFSTYHFEAFTLGIQKVLDQININDEVQMQKLRDKFYEIKKDNEFRRITTGGGKNSLKQLCERIAFVESRVEAIL